MAENTLQRKYVITGGPSVGKTTVINELAIIGYNTVPEVARQMIQEQLPAGILPWNNLFEFERLVLERQLDLESRLNGATVFLDRGANDIAGYCNAGNISIPPEYQNIGKRYAAVFLLEQLPQYSTDAERKEDAEHAKKIHDAIKQAYIDAGYEVIKVPVLQPKERAEYIINKIRGGKNGRML